MEENNNIPNNNFQFDFTLIANFFKGLDRQGPGGDEQTLKALSLIRELLPECPQVADVGCGTGRQTSVLAGAMDCRITAVDLLPEMIEGLKERIVRDNLQDKVIPLQASMEEMPFEEQSLDMIWAEGSIYHMGYAKGLEAWKKFLRPGGFVVLTEFSWLSDERPEEMGWFTDNFPENDSVSNKLAIMQGAGYQPWGHFMLPANCWTKNYYEPMERRMALFAEENAGNRSAQMLLDNLRIEIERYREDGRYYGYVFYIGRKM